MRAYCRHCKTICAMDFEKFMDNEGKLLALACANCGDLTYYDYMYDETTEKIEDDFEISTVLSSNTIKRIKKRIKNDPPIKSKNGRILIQKKVIH
jgi:RNase P subunit RPR2